MFGILSRLVIQYLFHCSESLLTVYAVQKKTVYANSLVITCRAKVQISNASRLQPYNQVASRQGDVMRQKPQPLAEPP